MLRTISSMVFLPLIELVQVFMTVFITCKSDEAPIDLQWGKCCPIDTYFIFYQIFLACDEDVHKISDEFDELIFRHSVASNSKGNIPIWPEFQLRRKFMPVLVTCKFDEDPIKTEGNIDRTRSNTGFLTLKGR